MKIVNPRNYCSRVIVAILSVVLMLALLAPNGMTLTANAVASSNGNSYSDGSQKQHVPLTNEAKLLLEDINATGDTPTEEENRGWCVLIDVTTSVNDGLRLEGEALIRELQKQYPKIDVLPFTYRLMLGEPYYEGMVKDYSTDIAASYVEAAREYDHLIIISDFKQSKGRDLEFGLQQHQDVWLYQLGEEDMRGEYFAEELESEMQSDCTLRLYRKDGVKMAYREDFPYDSHQDASSITVPTQASAIQETENNDDKVVVMMAEDTASFSMKELMAFIVLILGMIGIYCLASQGITAWRYRRANGADGAISSEKVEVGPNPYGSGVNITLSNVGNGGGNQMGMINACRCCRACNSCKSCTGCQVVDSNGDVSNDNGDASKEEAEKNK